MRIHAQWVDFAFEGFDEGTDVCGDGWAALELDDSLTGEIAFRNGGETTLKARAW
jgi:hypothetical protein